MDIVDLLAKNQLLLVRKQYSEMIQHGLLIPLMVQRISFMGAYIFLKRSGMILLPMNIYIRFPFVAISIALAINKRVEIGVIYNPILDLLYSAVRGKGSFRNGRPIKCSGQKGNLISMTKEECE